MFLLFTKACLLNKTFKIVFLRIIFTIYDMRIPGVTRGYKGWQEVTKGYRGLQGVTRGYRVLQAVTGGYKGWQVVTKGYKGWQGFRRSYMGLQRILEPFFKLERFQILFLGLFCIKIKVEEMSNFWSKRWTNALEKILILRFWSTLVFKVFKGFFFCLERQQTLFLDFFLFNTKDEKTSNVWRKSWTNSFGKMPILWVFETDVFVIYKGLFAK